MVVCVWGGERGFERVGGGEERAEGLTKAAGAGQGEGPVLQMHSRV